MASQEEQFLADISAKCAQFFKNLADFCKNYSKSVSAAPQAAKNDKNEKKKKLRKTTDPNLPKKPATPYLLYFQDKKPQFMQRHPDLALSALTKLIAKQWNQLPEENKRVLDAIMQPYLERAEYDRHRYDDELGNYKQKNQQQKQTKEVKQQKQSKKKKEKKVKPEQVQSDEKGSSQDK